MNKLIKSLTNWWYKLEQPVDRLIILTAIFMVGVLILKVLNRVL